MCEPLFWSHNKEPEKRPPNRGLRWSFSEYHIFQKKNLLGPLKIFKTPRLPTREKTMTFQAGVGDALSVIVVFALATADALVTKML